MSNQDQAREKYENGEEQECFAEDCCKIAVLDMCPNHQYPVCPDCFADAAVEHERMRKIVETERNRGLSVQEEAAGKRREKMSNQEVKEACLSCCKVAVLRMCPFNIEMVCPRCYAVAYKHKERMRKIEETEKYRHLSVDEWVAMKMKERQVFRGLV